MKPFRVVLGITVMLVCACDTGGVRVAGIEGGGAPSPSGSGIVGNGQITGLGSILVGGVEYSLDQANITIDGRPGTAVDLAVGQVVTFTGILATENTHGQALTVSHQTDISGPIDTVDPTGASITVLGQKVSVDPDLALVVGKTVAISGFRDAQGTWLARRVVPAAAQQTLIVTGSIDHLDPNAKTFTIGDLAVDYNAAPIAGLPNGLANGDVVRITGAARNTSGVLVASTITRQNPALPGNTGDAAFVEGWVTRFASTEDFDVNGHHVISSSVTPDPNPLGLNKFVQVNGTRRQDGGVEGQATIVQLVRAGRVAERWSYPLAFGWQGTFGSVVVDGAAGSDTDIKSGDVVTLDGEETLDNWPLPDRARTTKLLHIVAGPVDSLDPAHGRLVVMGQPVFVTGFSCTNIVGDVDLEQTLKQLQPGERVTVSGHDSRAGEIFATRITRVPSAPLLVSGYAQGLDGSRSQFTLNALTIDYGQAQLTGFPSDAPLSGDHVVVYADRPPVSGVLTATLLKRVPETVAGRPGADAFFEGLITRWTSASDFDVDGHRVSFSDVTSCDVSAIGLNDHVSVSGLLDAQGILRSLESTPQYSCPFLVQFDEVTLTGPIDVIDPAHGTLTILGFVVQTNMVTRITHDDGSGTARISLLDLQPGAFIRVHGLAGSFAGSIIASAIDVGAIIPVTAGIGVVDTLAYTLQAPAVVVAKRAIPTDASTNFQVTSSRVPNGLTSSSASPSAWFFSGDWQSHCNLSLPYAGSVRLTLNRGVDGAWLATDVEANGHRPCPDSDDDRPARQIKALCASR